MEIPSLFLLSAILVTFSLCAHAQSLGIEHLSSTAHAIDQGQLHYWYDQGSWYRLAEGRLVEVSAPLGAFVPSLPTTYSILTYQGVPYYYFKEVYYRWNAVQNAYEVVSTPALPEKTPAGSPQGLYIYPKRLQDSAQQAQDRYDCHLKAAAQSGFDPSEQGTLGTPAIVASYSRAIRLCLEAHGYSVN